MPANFEKHFSTGRLLESPIWKKAVDKEMREFGCDEFKRTPNDHVDPAFEPKDTPTCIIDDNECCECDQWMSDFCVNMQQ